MLMFVQERHRISLLVNSVFMFLACGRKLENPEEEEVLSQA